MRPLIQLQAPQERYQGNGFLIENVPLSKILKKGQTPLYVTSLTAVHERISLYKNTLKSHFPNSEIFYACKANFSQPILKEVLHAGAGIDIVSIGEWQAALKAGFHPKNICFAGVGKKEEEWKKTLEKKIGHLNVEHLQELEDILNYIYQISPGAKNNTTVSIRLNPCLEIETHPHLKTGSLDSKFGILFEQIQNWLLSKKQTMQETHYQAWLKPLKGIHVHIGSQLLAKDIFVHTVKAVMDCALFLFENGVVVNHLDFGGGLGVPKEGVALDGHDIVEHVHFLSQTIKNQSEFYPQLKKYWGNDFSKLFICLEPGRSVVASSTVFLTKVLYTKTNTNKNESVHFCYVDGAMNDFPRPSLYGAVHHAELVNFFQLPKAFTQEEKSYRIVGPVCESGDFLSKNTSLFSVDKNDIIAFFEAGAYCRSMASQYNLRPLPQELFIKKDKIIT